MSIEMIGIDHLRAPVPVRERFAFTKKACGDWYEELRAEPEIGGCVILSTCNRTEVWLDLEEPRGQELAEWLCGKKGLNAADYENYLVVREGAEAVEHLLHMTSGLRSLIVGEDQILSQVRAAWELARQCEATDKVLDVLFRMAVTGAKQVKSQMQLSTANTSAVEQALIYLKSRGVSFPGKRCLVIGNGEMGKRAALALKAEGAEVTVTVRQYRSGMVEIPAGCERINYGERLELLPDCDFVVSATTSPNVTVKYEEVSALALYKPQIYVDLAVPRDIDPRVATLPGCELYDIDQFPAAAASEEWQRSMAAAEDTLQKQKEEFFTWYECRDLVPRVQNVAREAADDLYWRLGKTLRRLTLEEEQSQLLEQGVREASAKVLQKFLFALRDEAGPEEFRLALDVAERIYHE